MSKLYKLGLYILFVGISMDLIYHSAPAAYQGTFDSLFGSGGLYAHLTTAAGIVMSMLVLLPNPISAPKRRRIKRID